jgi:beta-phosphoglucomutase-like phosphatase (HAD superfamily)
VLAVPVSRFAAVFFDFDGVLVDSESLWWDEIENLLRIRGILGSSEAVPERISGLPLTEALARSAPGLHQHEEDVSALAESIRDRVEPVLAAARLSSADIAAIRDIAGMVGSVGVVSSSPTELICRFIRYNSLDDIVRIVVGSDRVKAGKPAPDGYLLAAAEAGVEPDRCCAVEDSPSGLRSACLAGMYAVQFVRYSGRSREAVADAEVRSISDVAALVRSPAR